MAVNPQNAFRASVSDEGLDIAVDEYERHFVEEHRAQSTALFALLHGQPYLVGPLARLNLNLDRLPVASRVLLDKTGIKFPSNNMFHSLLARALEMHVAIVEAVRLFFEDRLRIEGRRVIVSASASS